MNTKIAHEIIDEGIEILNKKLGTVKTTKFFQLIGIGHGDSVKELREKTEKLSRKQITLLNNKTQKLRSSLWKKVHLI